MKEFCNNFRNLNLHIEDKVEYSAITLAIPVHNSSALKFKLKSTIVTLQLLDVWTNYCGSTAVEWVTRMRMYAGLSPISFVYPGELIYGPCLLSGQCNMISKLQASRYILVFIILLN